jgi:hypothetical protein
MAKNGVGTLSQQRITEALSSLFSTNPIVFWHDADGEFASSVESLKPSEIDLLDLDVTPWLQVKIELERAPVGASSFSTAPSRNPIRPVTGCSTFAYAASHSVPTMRRSCWKTWG